MSFELEAYTLNLTAAGTAENLLDSAGLDSGETKVARDFVKVRAAKANTGTILLGGEDGASGKQVYPLDPDEEIVLTNSVIGTNLGQFRLEDIWFDGATTNNKIHVMRSL